MYCCTSHKQKQYASSTALYLAHLSGCSVISVLTWSVTVYLQCFLPVRSQMYFMLLTEVFFNSKWYFQPTFKNGVCLFVYEPENPWLFFSLHNLTVLQSMIIQSNISIIIFSLPSQDWLCTRITQTFRRSEDRNQIIRHQHFSLLALKT